MLGGRSRDAARLCRNLVHMIRVRLQFRRAGSPTRPLAELGYRPRPAAFLLSLGIHAAFAFGLLHPTGDYTPASQDASVLRYRVTMLPPEERKLIWYPPRNPLPDISPVGPALQGPLRGRQKSAGETIIAVSKRPNAGKQLIWLPAPELPKPVEHRLPNMVMLAPQPAPPPPRRVFTPPMPPARPQPPAAPTLEAPAIQVAGAPARPALSPLQGLPKTAPKPAPKPFVPPSRPPKLPYGPAPVIDAPPPPISNVKPGGELGAWPGATSGARRRFVPPPPPAGAGNGAGTSGGAVAEAPPNLSPGSQTETVNMAVVGLNPAAALQGPLPQHSQPGNFSTAPNTGAPGGGNGEVAGIRVPGLTVRGGGAGSATQGPAPAPPPVAAAPQRVVVFETRLLQYAPPLSAPLRPSARTLPAPIEARFASRPVYTLVIEKPNLPEYADDWILWFAESEPLGGADPQMRAPVPFRKLEVAGQGPRKNGLPRNQRVRLALRIGTDGKPDLVAVLGALAPDLAQQAIEDLRKWEFRPALRNGRPVAVDAVLEIPFSGVPVSR